MDTLKKINKFLTIPAIAFFVLYGVAGFWSGHLIDTNGRYTIATIHKLKPWFRGVKIFFTYDFNGETISDTHIEKYDDVNNSWINRRFFIKVNPKYYEGMGSHKIYLDKLVPDSIKIAPIQGWREFPN